MRVAIVVLVLISACTDVSAPADDDPAETAGDGLLPDIDGKSDGPYVATGTTLAFQLERGAFPGGGHPDVVVYLPSRLDPTPPVDVIVFLHGWYNCASNVVGATDTVCTTGTGTRRSYALAAQLEAAHKNAILIVPELAYDQPSGDPGALAGSGAMRAMIDETLGHLGLSADDVGRLVVASHSGGYNTAAAFVHAGGMPVDELYLLDSLYGHTADFDAYVTSATADFTDLSRRFATVYTYSGGTLANSQAMATRAKSWVPASAIVDDRTTSTWTAPTYAHGLLFKRTGLTHDGVPRYYFGRLVATSGVTDVE